MATEKDLIQRIKFLEMQNSILQDKLDAIYAILDPEDEGPGEDGDDLVQIEPGEKPQ